MTEFTLIRHSDKIFDLLRLIAFQIGKEVSLPELANQLQLAKNTVEKYLDLLLLQRLIPMRRLK